MSDELKKDINSLSLESTKKAISDLESRIFDEVSSNILDAQTSIAESKILQKFSNDLNHRLPSMEDIISLKDKIHSAILEKSPNFDNFVELIVVRDKNNPYSVEISFNMSKHLLHSMLN